MEPRGAFVSFKTSENEVACKPCLASKLRAPSIICSLLFFLINSLLTITVIIIYYDDYHSDFNKGERFMPMIDIYAKEGTFLDKKKLATDAATTLKNIEGVPDIPMFRNNTAAFVHDLPAGSLSN